MQNEQRLEVAKCYKSARYFIDTHCQIYDATVREWLPFRLGPAQRVALTAIVDNRLVVMLKARQLGLTWLVLAYSLWLMVFRPAATVLLFSRRDDEAVYLLDERLKGMWRRLPDWLRSSYAAPKDAAHEWGLSNGSTAYAFPTTAGDTYTATLAVIDEADLVPDLGRLMTAVKPTIDGGGQMILLSRANKAEPESHFKAIYRAAKLGQNAWAPVFLPWQARPERDAAWYEAQRRDVLANTTALDDLHEQYPATDAEALAPKTLDKRIAPAWLLACYAEGKPLRVKGSPAIPGLRIYSPPKAGQRYVIGADPAEGNPTSDDSALVVLDVNTGEEVAGLAGKLQPATLAAHLDTIGTWYNRAALMVEKNNHGHAVLLWLRDNSRLSRLLGWDGKEGWLSNTKGKSLLYDTTADAFREGDTTVHSFESYMQLASIEGSSLKAPQGQHDDRADAFALALCARAGRGGVWVRGAAR